MAALDLTVPLPDLDADAPAGPNLELDGDFGALERAAQGTPERQAGDKIIPAEPPIWKDVAADAAALLVRTYDLRVLVILATARLSLSGLGDFAQVLAAIADLIETRWDHVHPQLDPEDDNDPALRANALLLLAHPIRVLRVLRTMTLATSKRAGAVSWRTIAVGLGQIETTDPDEKKTEAEIRAAFADTPPQRVDALRDSAAAAARAIDAIGAAFDAHSGYGNGPDLSPLTKLLKEIGRFVGLYYVPSEPEAAAETPDTANLTDESDMAFSAEAAGGEAVRTQTGGRAGGVTALALTSVATRTEALHLLDIVCRYYEQHEPSSPLPLMLMRARNLAEKTFLEILQELAPDGLGQAQIIVQSREG